MLTAGTITLRRLTAGEAAMMPLRIRSKRGVGSEQAAALVAEARGIAARFAGDAAVLSALAEAEYDAGNDGAAIAAADAALAIDAAQTDAYIQKGYALFRQAADADDRAAAYRRARAPFVTLNHQEPDHPLPLLYFFRSFVAQGIDPTPLALDGLARAVLMAPFDFDLRMTAGLAMIRAGRPGEARIALTPVAFQPHGGGQAEAARRVLARIDAEAGWRGAGIDALLRDPAEPARRSTQDEEDRAP